MPQLLVLPNEILLQIVENLSHGGLENFALTCKRNLDLSWGAIQEKKNTYSTIDCDAMLTKDGDREGNTFVMLRKILLDDSIGIYTKKVIIGHDLRGPRTRQSLQGIEHEIVSALRECPLLNDKRIEKYQSAIMSGSKPHAAALLVTLLPNLVSIEIKCATRYSIRCLVKKLRKISGILSYDTPDSGRKKKIKHLQQHHEWKRTIMGYHAGNNGMRAKRRSQALRRIQDVEISCVPHYWWILLRVDNTSAPMWFGVRESQIVLWLFILRLALIWLPRW